MSESAQILLAKQGDETAWLALVRQHQQVVFRFAWLLLDDADDAEDVAQETFIRAFHSLVSFETDRPLRPWLLQIAKNLAANRRRSLRRQIAVCGRWLRTQSLMAENLKSYESQIADGEALRQAVQRLDVAEQEIIYLRYFLELSVAESAEALNIAPGTVKSRLSRAVEKLRQIVVDENPELGREGAR